MEGNPICKMQGCSMDKVKYNIKQIKVKQLKQLKGYKLLSYIGGQEMRNKKKLKQAILNVHVAVVILVITIVSISSSYFVKAEENNKKIIMDVVENYFAERMDVLSKLEMNSSIKNYLLNDIDYYELDTLIKYRKLQIGDLRFKKINQTVELNNIEVEGDKAKVDVVLDEKITFNDSSDVISEESIEHNLTLICINNEWKIQHDDFDSDFKELFEKQQTNTSRKVMSSNNNLRNIQKQILTEEATEVSNKKKELEKIKTENDNQEKNLNKIKAKATKFKFKKYDREAASLYARKYAKNPNKDYPFYGKPDYKGDCTNFTSQCLYAGGIVTDNVGKYQWYKLNSAWRGANKFYEYWNNNKGSGSTKGLKASKSIFKDIRLADLIEKKPENAVTHTVIVTGYKVDSWGFNDPWKYKYDVLICQHSDDKKSGMLKDYPLSAKKWSTKETIYVKISGSYK